MYAQKRCKLDGIFEDTDFSSCSSEVAPQIEEIPRGGQERSTYCHITKVKLCCILKFIEAKTFQLELQKIISFKIQVYADIFSLNL